MTIKFAPDYKNEQGLGRVIEKTRYQIPQRGICARARPRSRALNALSARTMLARPARRFFQQHPPRPLYLLK